MELASVTVGKVRAGGTTKAPPTALWAPLMLAKPGPPPATSSTLKVARPDDAQPARYPYLPPFPPSPPGRRRRNGRAPFRRGNQQRAIGSRNRAMYRILRIVYGGLHLLVMPHETQTV